MNAVITSAKTFHRPLNYNFRKVEEGVGEVLYAQDISPLSYACAMQSVQPFIEMKARTKNRVFSCSINPHPDDEVSDEDFVRIAREFMEELGYGEQPYIVFKHTDIDRHHIHIVASRIDLQGHKVSDQWERERARRIMDRLERKYQLRLTSDYTTKEEAERVALEPIRPTEKDLRKKLGGVLLQLLPHIYFQSVGELNALLSRYNITAELSKTEHNGRLYDGIVYFVTDEEGNKVSPAIKGSALGRGCGLYAVQNRTKKSKGVLYKELPRLKSAVGLVLGAKPHSLEDLQTLLAQQGLEVVLRQNDKGRIYGVTYIDWDKGMAINGSRLGTEYSANALNKLLGGEGEDARVAPEVDRVEGQQNVPPPSLSLLNELLKKEHRGSAEWDERRFQNRLRREEQLRLWRERSHRPR